jgi:hypothetical protein
VGIKLFPGTLNVQFDEPYALPKRATWGIGVNGARTLVWDLSWAHWATNWGFQLVLHWLRTPILKQALETAAGVRLELIFATQCRPDEPEAKHAIK